MISPTTTTNLPRALLAGLVYLRAAQVLERVQSLAAYQHRRRLRGEAARLALKRALEAAADKLLELELHLPLDAQAEFTWAAINWRAELTRIDRSAPGTRVRAALKHTRTRAEGPR